MENMDTSKSWLHRFKGVTLVMSLALSAIVISIAPTPAAAYTSVVDDSTTVCHVDETGLDTDESVDGYLIMISSEVFQNGGCGQLWKFLYREDGNFIGARQFNYVGYCGKASQRSYLEDTCNSGGNVILLEDLEAAEQYDTAASTCILTNASDQFTVNTPGPCLAKEISAGEYPGLLY